MLEKARKFYEENKMLILGIGGVIALGATAGVVYGISAHKVDIKNLPTSRGNTGPDVEVAKGLLASRTQYIDKDTIDLCNKYNGNFEGGYVPNFKKEDAIQFVNDMDENSWFQIEAYSDREKALWITKKPDGQ